VYGKPAIRFVIYFYYKDYSLTSRAFATVDKVIAQLKRNPGKVAEVKGYTDNVGSTEYNNYLSMRRAQMAFDYMNSRGVPVDRVIVSYYGKEYPVADNTAANAWLNRRVEIIVHDKD
jgi:outer membrane protein OmpA-like peptidoglycan-associated protein